MFASDVLVSRIEGEVATKGSEAFVAISPLTCLLGTTHLLGGVAPHLPGMDEVDERCQPSDRQDRTKHEPGVQPRLGHDRLARRGKID